MRHTLTYEQLIQRVDEVAPNLKGIAYKLLWRLIAYAIRGGRPDVEVSARDLARGLNTSREGMAEAIRELGQYIQVEPRDGEGTVFLLPADWFPPQRTLFADETLGGDFHNRPNNQATTGLFTRPPVAHSPGHQWPNNQATRPNNQATSGLDTRPPGLTTRPLWPGNQATEVQDDDMGTRARVRSIESGSSVIGGLVCLIDRAWATVEIHASLEADAALLAQALFAYKQDLGPMREESAYPDTGILARLLALAPYEKIHCVLRTLRERRTPCGDQDAWFFSVMAQKIHHASPKLTKSRMDAAKVKPPSYESKAPLFGDALVQDVAGSVRRLG